MITGLVVIGLFVTVVVLVTRLHEARFQLGQVQRERDEDARNMLAALLEAATLMAEHSDRGAE